MDAERFDSLLRSLSGTPSRRGTLRLLAGSALGGLLTLHTVSTEAKKGGKNKGKGKGNVTLCHNGQTITVSSSAKRAHLKHGDTIGACPTSPPPPGCTPTCAVTKPCGPDGCGGSCGTCSGTNEVCQNGQCVCAANVVECGGQCCMSGQTCVGTTCTNGSRAVGAACDPTLPGECSSGKCGCTNAGCVCRNADCLGFNQTCFNNFQCCNGVCSTANGNRCTA